MVFKFEVHRAVHRNIVSIVKPTRCTNVSNLFYFWMTLHVSDGFSVHHQEFKTVHTATGICQTDTAVCTVLNSWWWTERPSETCRVSFQNKINLIQWCNYSVLLQKWSSLRACSTFTPADISYHTGNYIIKSVVIISYENNTKFHSRSINQ